MEIFRNWGSNAQKNKQDLFPGLENFERSSVEQLKKPVQKIIKELQPEIEKGSYSLIIADDSSGRIPALMVGHVIKEIYEQRGFPAPLFRPIAGSSRVEDSSERTKKADSITAHIGEILKTFKDNGRKLDKTLVVTDTVSLGRSINLLSEALKKNHLSFDVATIAFAGEPIGELTRELEKRWGSRIVYAERSVPNIYYSAEARGGKELSGVKRSDPNLFSISNEADELKLRSARKLAKEIAHEVAVRYMEKNPRT